MSDILFKILRDKVYKEDEIRAISLASTGKMEKWIFDFKGQCLSKFFLQEYAEYFWKTFRYQYPGRLQIGGMEVGAIPLVAGVLLQAEGGIVASGFYIRKSRKKGDLANMIEGELSPDFPIILVDDILNSGTTMRKQIKILEDLGLKVAAVFVCLRYRNKAYYQDLIDQGISVVSIFDLDDFKHVLPVSNLVDRAVFPNKKYAINYKVRLTDKPNLYSVESKSNALVVEGYVYIGSDDGFLYCLRADNGDVVWKYKVPFGFRGKQIFSSPAIDKDSVVFGAYDGNVYCLDRFSGKRIWVYMDADWVGSSPCIDNTQGVVYIGLEFSLPSKQGGIVALDVRTGEVLWKNYEIVGKISASPVIDKKSELVFCGCDDKCFYAFNKRKGNISWVFKTDGMIKQGAAFDSKRNLILFGSMDGGLYVLHASNGKLFYKFEARFGFYSTPLIKDEYVISGSMDKNVYCFNLVTKKTVWVFETAGRIFASPTLSSESVFIGGNDGRLYELDLYTGKLLSQIQLTERIVNRVSIEYLTEGKRTLYISTHVCELYRIDEMQN